MDHNNRHPLLVIRMRALLQLILICLTLQGCGLITDAIQLVWPLATDDISAICRRGRLQVGIAAEPFQPFVFPAIFTDEGLRVTGMDVALVQEIARALEQRCGGHPVTPMLHLVRFRDLFVLLQEGKLDLFASAISANVPSPVRIGLAYSSPYFYDGGITGITRSPNVIDRLQTTLRQQGDQRDGLSAMKAAVAGLVVAVQEGTSAHFYALEQFAQTTLIICDSLPAAFEYQNPAIDVILGKLPVLQYTTTRTQKDWHLLTDATGKPVTLTREQYTVVLGDERIRLQAFINDLLFKLDESGKLAQMRTRWLDERYAFPRRAATEGLPFDIENMAGHYDQGSCRPAPRR